MGANSSTVEILRVSKIEVRPNTAVGHTLVATAKIPRWTVLTSLDKDATKDASGRVLTPADCMNDIDFKYEMSQDGSVDIEKLRTAFAHYGGATNNTLSYSSKKTNGHQDALVARRDIDIGEELTTQFVEQFWIATIILNTARKMRDHTTAAYKQAIDTMKAFSTERGYSLRELTVDEKTDTFVREDLTAIVNQQLRQHGLEFSTISKNGRSVEENTKFDKDMNGLQNAMAQLAANTHGDVEKCLHTVFQRVKQDMSDEEDGTVQLDALGIVGDVEKCLHTVFQRAKQDMSDEEEGTVQLEALGIVGETETPVKCPADETGCVVETQMSEEGDVSAYLMGLE